MEKNFETELPENYRQVKVVDAKNKKTVIIFSILSFVPLLIIMPIVFLTCGELELTSPGEFAVKLFIFAFACIAYIILHELTHGLVYKIMTRQKLTFGFTLTVAFCGVPNIYTYRKTMMWAVIMPFVVFSVVFGGAMIAGAFLDKLTYILSALLFSIHVGGCVGDLYVFALTLFKYRDKRLLLRDTGPAQYFYMPDDK